jgi:hypothetical protein
MTGSVEIQRLTRRELLLHDALAFLVLTLITVALFVMTLFLFRSFTNHRAEQARVWTANGQQALNTGDPEDAVNDLRTALMFAPGTPATELLLAQSLAAAGPKHTDEAYNAFLELWDVHPGDGQINLQLARLAARRGDPAEAVRFYRAAIDGRWDENGAVHRREGRLELARFLIAQHNNPAAREELLVVAGNWPRDEAVQREVDNLLAKVGTSQ